MSAPVGVALLDVNFLIAMAWPNHVHHQRARTWFAHHHRAGWATTPVTEIGFVRVSSNRSAISVASTPDVATRVLRDLTALPGHRFWVDDIAHVTGEGHDVGAAPSHRDVTDVHLVALARRHAGKLVSFDARIARLLPDAFAELLEVPNDAIPYDAPDEDARTET